MNAARFGFLASGVISLSLSVACSMGCAQQTEPAKPQPVLAGVKFRLDVGKSVVERPTEQLLASAATAANDPTSAFVNPKVEPGKVKWHADFATARAASAKSGKPVLLFQMMGKLDDQFC
jgi:hypothetical protein